MSSTISGLILPFDPSNSQRAATVQKYWIQAGLEGAKSNATRVIFEENGALGLVSLGKEFSQKTENEKSEVYRKAVATGLKSLVGTDIKDIAVEVGAYPHVAGELSSFSVNQTADI
jgi:hypothetical protein